MFDFSSIFSPERLQQGAQGVQGVQNMPWVFHNYLQQLMGMQQAQQPAAPPEQSPLQQLLGQGMNPDDANFWNTLRLQNDGGGA